MLENHKLIELMEDNMRSKLQYIPSMLPDMTIDQIADTAIVNTGMPTDTFNTAYAGTITEPHARAVMQYFKNAAMPMAWWVGPESTAHSPHCIDSLGSAGFTHDEQDIGMYAYLEDLNLGNRPDNSGLHIKLCSDAKDYLDFGYVLASIFDPVDTYVQIFYQKTSMLPASSMTKAKLFVGYAHNKPVTTGCLFLTDFAAGFYDIATCPNQQRRGFGSAMFHHLVAFAHQAGYKHGVLQASADGLNIYKRIGFQSVCEFNVWSNKNTLD